MHTIQHTRLGSGVQGRPQSPITGVNLGVIYRGVIAKGVNAPGHIYQGVIVPGLMSYIQNAGIPGGPLNNK